MIISTNFSTIVLHGCHQFTLTASYKNLLSSTMTSLSSSKRTGSAREYCMTRPQADDEGSARPIARTRSSAQFPELGQAHVEVASASTSVGSPSPNSSAPRSSPSKAEPAPLNIFSQSETSPAVHVQLRSPRSTNDQDLERRRHALQLKISAPLNSE